MSMDDEKLLRLLSDRYPDPDSLCAECAAIGAELSLPMGTEHFMSDIHGEYEAFCHIMNNCSGVIREKVVLWLGDGLTGRQVDEICTLIYYPDAMLRRLHRIGKATPEWYRERFESLILLARMLSTKYSRERVRAAMPREWVFLLEELMHDQSDEGETRTEQEDNRRRYHDAIITSLIDTGGCDSLMKALIALIKDLAVDRLHVVGDIFDRGPRADSVMDILVRHRAIDIEWGNHDVLWMGAASGNDACIFGVLRNSLAYGNTVILERGYGIPLRELSMAAEKLYPDMPADKAMLHLVNIMMFKLEGQIILRHPEYGMEDRLLLHKIDREKTEVEMDGAVWPLRPVPFDTVDPSDPYALCPEEEKLREYMSHAFRHSPRLREHIAFLYRRGSMYRVYNGNLLFHGCVPMTPEGGFGQKTFGDETYSGKAFMDHCDRMARQAFHTGDTDAVDLMWYLWCGTDSPVCGRRIKTFARVFIPDERAWEEKRDPYYLLYNDEKVCERILSEFGLTDPQSRIINGHTPIRVTHGESPLKANGRLIVIDGGFCRAYQKTTGIAGYTLIANSHGMRLMSHHPFTSVQDALESGADIHSQSFEFASWEKRRFVADTDRGRLLQDRLQDLRRLLAAYRDGTIHPAR